MDVSLLHYFFLHAGFVLLSFTDKVLSNQS